MDTRNLESFCTIYECGSINKAASLLHISSQGLSKVLAKLEAELGHSLFTRSTTGVVPTSYACDLYPRVLKACELLRPSRPGSCGDGRTVLRIPMGAGAITYLGCDFFDSFWSRDPSIHLRVDEFDDKSVVEKVMGGRSEVGLASGVMDCDALIGVPLFSQRYVLVVHEDDPLAHKDAVAYDDLEGRELIHPNGGFSVLGDVQQHLGKAGVHLGATIGVVQDSTGGYLASCGRGLWLTTAHAALLSPWPRTRIVPFADPACMRDMRLVRRRDAILSEGARTFWDYALEWAAAHDKTQ